jgi:hypothetical protein
MSTQAKQLWTPSDIEAAYPVRDGFVLRTDHRCEATFLDVVVAEYEALRRLRAMRPKYWMVPVAHSYWAIPSLDAYELELTVVPGGVIWGWIFVPVDGATGPFSFQVRDSCTDVPLLSEVVRTDQFTGGDMDGNTSFSYSQNLLSKLLIVPAPGLLTVEICSQQSSPARVQLVLCGGEPVCV